MKKFLSFGLTVCLALLLVTSIFADQITLKNGDRLSGKIIKQDDEKIVLQTEFAGIITISKTNIEKIVADAAFTKEAKEETPTEKTETEKTTAESTEKVEEKTEEKTENEAATPAPSKRQSALTEGWDGAANVGFSLTSGNADTKTFTAGVRAEKSGASDKWTTYLNTLWNSNRVGSTNVTTSNAIWGGLRYDRNINKKLFAFGLFDFERDIPQKLNFRSVLGAGFGYHAIKNDQTELDFFGGAAWNNSWYIGPNKSSAELLVGNTLKHKFSDRVKFQQGFTLYPNLTTGGEYRFIFDSTLSADLTKRIGWFTTVANRYNSLPLLGVDKNDFLFATGLKIGFGKTK